MRQRLIPTILLLLSSWCAGALAATSVVVHEVDDSTVTGNLLAAHGGTITIEIKTPQKATTRATISLDDISQVVIQSAHAPAPARPAKNRRAPAKTAATTQPASRPATDIDWQARLAAGDQLHATIVQWSDQTLQLKPDALPKQTIQLPAGQWLELWCGAPALRAKARALHAAASPDDTAFVENDGNVVAVNGTALGITGDSLRFEYGDSEKKIALDRLVGIVAGDNAQPKTSSPFRQAVKLDSGDVLCGKWFGLKDNSILLRTVWRQTLSIPLSRVNAIDSLNGRLVYLSDLTPSKVEQIPFFERVIPFRLDASLDGGPLQLSDGQYAKGIAMHARCRLEYDIQGDFTEFRAKVGLEQPGGRLGRTVIHLLGDGKPLYENPDAAGDQPPSEISADVTGIHQLVLEVDFGKSQDVGARVIWANPRLLRPKIVQPLSAENGIQ